jgi:hypothetical protein
MEDCNAVRGGFALHEPGPSPTSPASAQRRVEERVGHDREQADVLLGRGRRVALDRARPAVEPQPVRDSLEQLASLFRAFLLKQPQSFLHRSHQGGGYRRILGHRFLRDPRVQGKGSGVACPFHGTRVTARLCPLIVWQDADPARESLAIRPGESSLDPLWPVVG